MPEPEESECNFYNTCRICVSKGSGENKNLKNTQCRNYSASQMLCKKKLGNSSRVQEFIVFYSFYLSSIHDLLINLVFLWLACGDVREMDWRWWGQEERYGGAVYSNKQIWIEHVVNCVLVAFTNGKNEICFGCIVRCIWNGGKGRELWKCNSPPIIHFHSIIDERPIYRSSFTIQHLHIPFE